MMVVDVVVDQVTFDVLGDGVLRFVSGIVDFTVLLLSASCDGVLLSGRAASAAAAKGRTDRQWNPEL